MTNAECSTTRGTAFDARNGQTYYVQKIGNLCWMESNLRYAGDGDWYQNWSYPDDRYATTIALAANTQNQNDNVRPLALHSNSRASYMGDSISNSYATAAYIDLYARRYGTNTLDATTPTNNTLFYGYLYNWCAAMGGQPNACSYGGVTTGFDTTQSICPAGWRLPTGGSGGEYQTMANAIGATNSAAGNSNLRNNFLAVYSGNYSTSLVNQDSGGDIWSSTAESTAYAYGFYFNYAGVAGANGMTTGAKHDGIAVRCVK